MCEATAVCDMCGANMVRNNTGKTNAVRSVADGRRSRDNDVMDDMLF